MNNLLNLMYFSFQLHAIKVLWLLKLHFYTADFTKAKERNILYKDVFTYSLGMILGFLDKCAVSDCWAGRSVFCSDWVAQ